jgi:NitT/TauT family transport system substrate-binding protein
MPMPITLALHPHRRPLARLTFAMVVLTAAFMMLFALARHARAATPGKLVVGHDLWIGYAGVFIAKDKGFFKDAGLEVELKPFSNPGDTLPALATGQIDIGLTTLQNLALLNGNGDAKVVSIGLLDSSNGADAIVAKAGIKDVAALKGKTVAATIGEVNHMLLLMGLQKAGLKESDIKLTSMSADDAGAAFVAGKVDAAVTWEPWVTKAKAAGGKIIFTSADVPNTILDCVAVEQKNLAGAGKDYAGFLKAIDRGVAFLRSDPKAARTIIGKYLNSPPDDVTGMLSGDKIYDLADNQRLFGGKGKESAALQSMTKVIDFAKGAKLIKRPVTSAGMFDARFVAK